MLGTLLVITQTFITASGISIDCKFSELHVIIEFQRDKVSRIDSLTQFDESILIQYRILFATLSKSVIHIVLLNFIKLTQLAPRRNIDLQPTLMHRHSPMIQIMRTRDDHIPRNKYPRSSPNLILMIPPNNGHNMFMGYFGHITLFNKTKQCIAKEYLILVLLGSWLELGCGWFLGSRGIGRSETSPHTICYFMLFIQLK